MSQLQQRLQQDQNEESSHLTREHLAFVATSENYVGELWSISFEDAVVLVHDRQRRDVDGLPNQCFLVATRLRAGSEVRYDDDDATLILLRVMDSAALPNASEQERIRAQAGQRSVGYSKPFWDDKTIMDGFTANELSFAGVRCRVIGTFYLEQTPGGAIADVTLRFGSDIANFYPNMGLKVYKPRGKALDMIVNYRDLRRAGDHKLRDKRVTVGNIRYASTRRRQPGVDDVEIVLAPTDLLGQKTALFGMTRTGKSNTTKIIAKSIFELRFDDETTGALVN